MMFYSKSIYFILIEIYFFKKWLNINEIIGHRVSGVRRLLPGPPLLEQRLPGDARQYRSSEAAGGDAFFRCRTEALRWPGVAEAGGQLRKPPEDRRGGRNTSAPASWPSAVDRRTVAVQGCINRRPARHKCSEVYAL